VSGPCDKPLDQATLVGYWLDDGEGQDLDSIEEHLLGCDSCGRRLGGLVALGEGIRRLAHEGAVEVVVTQAGLRTREYRVTPGGRVDCTVLSEDDLLVARLMGDFKGLSRLDLVAEQEGLPSRRIEDVPIRPEATELIVVQAMPYMRTVQHARIRIRLLSQEAGGERLVGEYTFDHHPSPG
jgi:hypothetical protein